MSIDDTSVVYRNDGYCPVCEKRTTFSARFDWYRDHLLCETCGSIPRERAAALVLIRHRPQWRELAIHESSPEPRGVSLKLRNECRNYTASNYFPKRPLGELIDRSRNENLEAQTFASESFDLVVALDVLEHVNRPDDAVSEIARTLKVGGMLIFSAPTYKEKVVSERRAQYRPDHSIDYLAEAEHHGNPVSAEGSLVTFQYGYDLTKAIFEWSGLDVEVSRFHHHEYGLIGEFTEIYVAIKTRPSDSFVVDRSQAVGDFVDPDFPIRALARKFGGASGVPSAVHPEDAIFQFIWNNPAFSGKDAAVGYYFDQGRESAIRVKDIVARWMPARPAPLNILEFAAGYGAVTRHAKGLLSPHTLVASDIHPQANTFIGREMGVATVPSALLPEDLALPLAFDVIFALSFFSHMPRATWTRWLNRLYDGLAPGGLLVFTTHGRESMKYFPAATLDATGYWFDASSEQGDLDTANYGQAITTKEFVDAQIRQLSGVEYLEHDPSVWWGHQDLYILRRGSVPA